MADAVDPTLVNNAMMKAICQGSRVRRNPDTWQQAEEDGGDGCQGTVTWCDTAVGRASVLWDATQVETTHDLSYDGRFELIVTGHEDRWLSSEDFPVGTRCVHDFRGPGVVSGKEVKNGINYTRVQFDSGESHAYKESYFMQGKISKEDDAAKRSSVSIGKFVPSTDTQTGGEEATFVVQSFEDAKDVSAKIADEMRGKGITIPKASTAEEARELARWVMKQYPQLDPSTKATPPAAPAAEEPAAESAALTNTAKDEQPQQSGEAPGTIRGVQVVPPGWKPQDDELMQELDQLYDAMDQMAKSPQRSSLQNHNSSAYGGAYGTALPLAPYYRPCILPPELHVLTHAPPPVVPYTALYSSPYASPYRQHLGTTA